MATPEFILNGVEDYIEYGDPTSLKRMFLLGIRLQDFPESREVIIKLLDGEKIRKSGGGGHIRSRAKEMNIKRAKSMYCELVAAGMMRYSEFKETAALAVEARFHEEGRNDGFSAKRFYETHLKNNEDVERRIDGVKKLIEKGTFDKQMIFDVYKEYLLFDHMKGE